MQKQKTHIGLSGSQYKPLSESAVRSIEDSVYRILWESGVLVYSPTARNAFQRAGAEVDNDSFLVRLPRSLVEDSIASAPSSVTLYSRNGEYDCVLEKNKVHYGTGGTAIYVLDPDTGKRVQSKTKDVILNARMVEQLENIHLFTINVFPNEIKKRDSIDINRFFHALDNTHKHVMGGIYSLEGCKKVVKLAEMIAGSREKLVEKPFVSFITLIISPFKIDNEYGEMSCFLAENGIPVVVPTEPVCGTTSPVTLAGNVLVHITETIAGIAMTQCVRRGAPAICGSVGSITNLATMDHVGGAIERAMINAAVSQMAQHFQLPFYGTGGTSDAQDMDIQAAYESAMSSLIVAMSGATYIHDIAGLMETDLTVSYEKLVVDNEILGMCQRVLRGIDVNDDTLGTDMIIAKGPGKDFLMEEHTIEHMRGEFYEPQLANRKKRELTGEEDNALARAKKFIKQIRTSPPVSTLGEDLRRCVLNEFPEIVDTGRDVGREGPAHS
jgi:trimethylamine--corrinoid protein Co-methyltransferase